MSLLRATFLLASPLRIPLSSTRFQSRCLSSQGSVAAEKLRNALEEYRSIHFTQCLPSRFKKEIVKAAKQKESSDEITLQGMHRVLGNINMQHKVSYEEMDRLFQEIGGEGRVVAADHMMKIL